MHSEFATNPIDPTLSRFLTSWTWRPDVLLVLIALGTAYTTGWSRLRKRGARIANPWRLLAYLAGLTIVGVALLSPIDAFASVLFLMHMVQHELLIMVAPPLLLLADPLPVILWGLPRQLRLTVRYLLGRGKPVRRILHAATWMPVAWGIYVVNLWAWHTPAAYEAALRGNLIHDLAHVAFFGSALLFWWPIINPAPRLHGHIHHGYRIAYVVAATGQNTLLGALIALTERVLYPHYADTPFLWGLSPLDNQAFGGAIMWEGGTMYVITILVLLATMLQREERMTRQREAKALTLTISR